MKHKPSLPTVYSPYRVPSPIIVPSPPLVLNPPTMPYPPSEISPHISSSPHIVPSPPIAPNPPTAPNPPSESKLYCDFCDATFPPESTFLSPARHIIDVHPKFTHYTCKHCPEDECTNNEVALGECECVPDPELEYNTDPELDLSI